MNQVVNKFLLAGDKFMTGMHLTQPGFAYSGCGPFTKNKQRIKKFMQTGDTNYIYRSELNKAYFQHDMAYGKYKDLKILENTKYDGYQRGLASMVYKRFDKFFNKSGHLLASLLEMSLIHMCFSNILLVKTNYLVST